MSIADEAGLKFHLTVGRLKELLQDIPDDYLVYTEGCDCVGPSDGIWEAKHCKDKQVIISRNDSLPDN